MANTDSFYLQGNNGYSILLCHPLAETPAMMSEFGKKLHKKGYTVSCPLLKGHGTSFLEILNSSFDEWYIQLKTEYNRLSETSKVFICGMSIGGTMAVKLAEELTPQAIATINAPIIGFDLISDVHGFQNKAEMDQEVTSKYKEHREIYFKNVVETGQIENLKKITTPLFVLQGSLDIDRYKTSSHMLMTYVSSTIKQRKDYKKSRHLVLLGQDKKQAMKDIYNFFNEHQ